nr:hypothetical protein [Spirochaeta thermophila]
MRTFSSTSIFTKGAAYQGTRSVRHTSASSAEVVKVAMMRKASASGMPAHLRAAYPPREWPATMRGRSGA